MMPWALWAEDRDGQARFYEIPVVVEGRLPTSVEYSGDGCWATLYEGKKPVRTWMWMGLNDKKHQRQLAASPKALAH